MTQKPSGLSRRDLTSIKGFEPVLPELGKIKIGKKGQLQKSNRGSDYQRPLKLDHFQIVGLERGPDNNLLVDTALHKLIGDKPRELDVVFPYNEIDLNFLTFYAWYSSRVIRCRGNGEIAFRLDEKTGDYNEIPCDPSTCPIHTPPPPKNQSQKPSPVLCKPNGILSAILMKAPRLGGVYKFRTTSYHTIRNILSSLQMIKQLTGGSLAGIPLKLTLKPQTVNPKGTAGAIVVHVVSVEWVGTLEELYAKALEQAGMRAKSLTDLRVFEEQTRKALTAAPDESAAEALEITEEFYPDTIEGELIEGGLIEGDAVKEPKAKAKPKDKAKPPPKNKAQGAQGGAQEPKAPTPDKATPPESGDPREGEGPPVEAYADDLLDDAAPPPGYSKDSTPPEAATTAPEEEAPAQDVKPDGDNRPTNKNKKRRI